MKTVKFLSPSSIGAWQKDREEYYLRYLADKAPPKIPQTQPMSIGSAFDAYAKSYLVERLIGKKPEFEFDTIFTQQVEPLNRDWARIHGKYAFEAYRECGALTDLLLELDKAALPPRFEFSVEGVVDNVPLLGKPDIYYVTKNDSHIIVDWKVNGYCSKNGVTPKPGYVKIYSKGEKEHGRTHRDAHVMMVQNVEINVASTLDQVDDEWARQLTIYAWLLGEPIGGRFITCIEQLACAPNGAYPKIRVASHRCRVNKDYQTNLLATIVKMWTAIQNNHIFEDLSLEASQERGRALDTQHIAFEGTEDKDLWFRKMQRGS